MPPAELLSAEGEEDEWGKSSESRAGESTTPAMSAATAATKKLAALQGQNERAEGLSHLWRGLWLI